MAESWAPIVTPSETPIRILPGRNVVLKARYENRQILNCSLIPSHGEMVNLVAGYHLGQNLTYWGDGYDNGKVYFSSKTLPKTLYLKYSSI